MCTRIIYAISSFPPLRAEENWKANFTADESSGKAATTSFPPLGEEENWNANFTADESSGKAATASFPPLGAEENWKVRFTAAWSSGKAAILPVSSSQIGGEPENASLPPMQAAVKPCECPIKVARPFHFQLTQDKTRVSVVPFFLVAHI